MRRRLAGVAAVLCCVALASPARGDDLASAHKSAQERANRAAARLAAAQTALARAQAGVDTLQMRFLQDTTRLGGLRSQVEALALREYMRGETTPTFLFDKDLNKLSRNKALLRLVTIGDLQAIDEFRAAREDLEAVRSRLGHELTARRSALSSLRAEARAAVAELDRLAAEERAAETQKAAAAARAAAAKPVSRSAPAPAPAAPSGPIATGSWVCPVQGPHSFSDDYGQPRPGGRTHQGNDILAPRGTPVVANVSGSFSRNYSGRGGNSYFLEGDDGHEYFGAHLDSYSGAGGHVAAGTVLGYVGNTGDASGGPAHLHFEIHVGGHPIDPYPTLVKYC